MPKKCKTMYCGGDDSLRRTTHVNSTYYSVYSKLSDRANINIFLCLEK